MLKPIGFAKGRVATLDDEIAEIEEMVESNNVEFMLNIIIEKMEEPVKKVHVMTLGTPLDKAEEILKLALHMIREERIRHN